MRFVLRTQVIDASVTRTSPILEELALRVEKDTPEMLIPSDTAAFLAFLFRSATSETSLDPIFQDIYDHLYNSLTVGLDYRTAYIIWRNTLPSDTMIRDCCLRIIAMSHPEMIKQNSIARSLVLDKDAFIPLAGCHSCYSPGSTLYDLLVYMQKTTCITVQNFESVNEERDSLINELMKKISMYLPANFEQNLSPILYPGMA